MNWTYTEGDPSIVLFTTAVQRFGLSLPANAVVAELGCAETDWLERMGQQNPGMTLIGVDARPHEGAPGYASMRKVGSAMDPDLFAENSLDAVVMLGALEHFGLGYYGDPVDEDGDIKTMQNVARWLKPGGWVYADVPCNLDYSITENRHFRIYDFVAYFERLVENKTWPCFCDERFFCAPSDPEIGQGYDGWPIGNTHPYHYCAFTLKKGQL